MVSVELSGSTNLGKGTESISGVGATIGQILLPHLYNNRIIVNHTLHKIIIFLANKIGHFGPLMFNCGGKFGRMGKWRI
jgi:hypothetical protein